MHADKKKGITPSSIIPALPPCWWWFIATDCPSQRILQLDFSPHPWLAYPDRKEKVTSSLGTSPLLTGDAGWKS